MAVETDVRALKHGQHVCLGYRADAEREEVLNYFVAGGLARGERIYYFAHREPVDDILTMLHRNGLDPSRAVDDGRLTIQSASDSYLKSGTFDPDVCMNAWISTIDSALSEGFSGVRVAADMSWALENIEGVDKLLQYERLLGAFVFAGRPLVGLCEFDARLFGSEAMDQLVLAHEDGITRAPALLETMQIRVLKSFSPPGLKVSGALTRRTKVGFEAALRHVVHTTAGDIRLDLEEVREIDDIAFQSIVRAARELYTGRHLVITPADALKSLDLSEATNVASFRIQRTA